MKKSYFSRRDSTWLSDKRNHVNTWDHKYLWERLVEWPFLLNECLLFHLHLYVTLCSLLPTQNSRLLFFLIWNSANVSFYFFTFLRQNKVQMDIWSIYRTLNRNEWAIVSVSGQIKSEANWKTNKNQRIKHD